MFTIFASVAISAQQISIFGGGQTISDNSGNSPALNNLTDFGNTTSRTFTLDNSQSSGNTTLNVTSIVLSNTTDFTISTDPTPVGIVKNGTNPTFTITYIGTGTGLGITSDVIVYSSNASNDGAQISDAWVFTISIDVAANIDIEDASGNAIDDGGGNSPAGGNSTAFGTTDSLNPLTQTYTILSSGAAALNITSWTSSSGDFSVSAPISTNIGSGLSTTFIVTFTPSGNGSISGVITINSDATSPKDEYTFNVQGTGTLPPPVYTVIYHTFDDSNEGWTASTSTNDSWIRTNSFTTADEMGEGYYFRNSAYNTYPANVNIEVESPVYNFTGLQNLKLSIDIKYNTENGNDGLRILYSVNGGTSYSPLGSNGDGTNWYQGNVTALGGDGWSDDGHSPDTPFSPHSQFGKSSIPLSGGTFSGQSNVRFKIQFSSDGSSTREGVAFDNFLIEADPTTAISDATVAPANITSNLRLWLKTNEGISNADNTPLTLWEDQAYSNAAIDKEDAFAETTLAPTYRDSGDRNINYNPVVDFDHNNIEYMNGKGGLFSQDYFVIFRSDDTVANETGGFSPGREFAIGGRFADVSFHEDATGIAMGSSTARYDNEILAHNISSFPNGSQAPNATSYGRGYSTTTDTYSNHPLIINVKSNASRTASEIYKNGKRIDNVTGKAGNGVDLNFNEVNNLPFLIGTGRSGINGRTTSQMNGMIAEVISYSSPNSAINQKKIQSYLAVKYGVTLQDNASALLNHRLNDTDYIDSQETVIWDTSATDDFGNFHNYDVAGIGRDDASHLDQRQSRSQNDEVDASGAYVGEPNSGFLTMALTDTYNTNNENLAATSPLVDRQFLMWGNNNADLGEDALSTVVDMSEKRSDDTSDPSLKTEVSFVSMARIWKVVETGGDVGKVEVSIPESVVRAATPPNGRYLMFISADGEFTPTADFREMTEIGDKLYVDYDFDGIEYITFGWAPEKLFERSIYFDPSDSNYIDIEDNLDLDAANSNTTSDFTISAWINRGANSANTSIISKRNIGYTEGYDLKLNSSNRVEISWWTSGSNKFSLTSDVEIPLGIWHQIAVVFDGSIASLYIDGVLDKAANTAPPLNTNSSFFIGAAAKNTPEAYFHGNIDEVRVWNKALQENELRFIMNQELQDNPNTLGLYFNSRTIVPSKNDASALSYANLEGYYPMSRYTYTNTKDESGNQRTGALKQLKTVDYQTAPLPYMSTQDGDWTDETTWVNGDVQYTPGSRSLANNDISVDWNVVQTSHNIMINNDLLVDNDGDINTGNNNEGNRTVLAHILDTGEVTVDGDNTLKTGNGYTVTHYLSLDGKLDLEGESQLIQNTDSDLIVGVNGELEKDQQGTTNMFHYNYWSMPIGATSIDPTDVTNINRYSYSVTDVMKDRNFNVNFTNSGYDGAPGDAGTPITIADYWIWKFANNTDGDYSEWEHVRRTGTILPGEGFTMKGPGSSGAEQNYTFLGKPNNADVNLVISEYNDYLVGNPYASAIDADQFILDNGPQLFYQEGTIQAATDSAGNPVVDPNGNPVYTDNDDNLYYMTLDVSNNPILDGNGNPVYEDGDGNSHFVPLDSNGDPVADSNGNPVYTITSTTEVDATTSGTLYFWEHWGGTNHILAQYQGGYATYNLAGGASAPFGLEGENHEVVGAGGTPTKTPGRYIPVGQGFFVVGDNDGTINFNNGQRVFKKESTANGAFIRSANTDISQGSQVDFRPKIKIGFNSVSDLHRQLLLTIDKRTTAGIDWGYDGVTYDYLNDDMFWLIEDNFYVIQGANDMSDSAVYPLAIYTSEEGENTITIDEITNVPDNVDVFIHDKEVDFYQNLREGDYTVFLNAEYYDNRFEITFRTNALEHPEEQSEEVIEEDVILEDFGDKLDVRYSSNSNKIVLMNPHGIKVQNIQLYNILGQKVQVFNQISESGYSEYNIGNLSSGAYIIRLNTESGSVSKKVLIN